MIEPKVFSVGQINRYIKNLLENDFILNSLLVQGEISNFKAHSSGHWYFTLKDAQGAIACVMFQQDAAQVPFLPENGMQVILYGHVSLYERTGQYQLYGRKSLQQRDFLMRTISGRFPKMSAVLR